MILPYMIIVLILKLLNDYLSRNQKNFFNLETEIKNKYANPAIGGARGYTPFGKETALGESVPDLKEFNGPKIGKYIR